MESSKTSSPSALCDLVDWRFDLIHIVDPCTYKSRPPFINQHLQSLTAWISLYTHPPS
jgi:hypothetical protein